ncbi:energy-coupling factor transporter transmembrane component T family protein [Stackebrandtia soli]|uniref:energy-coupling factor transporter transmembrane component T family protein n=1 Tax=Stackebrandtia soli TaxID=1892856 RepID=UPI0039EAC6EE
MLNPSPIAHHDARIARYNPVAKVTALLIWGLTAMAATDWLTPALLLTALAVIVPLSGVDARALLSRSRFLWLAAAMVSFVNTVFAAERTGAVILDVGPILIAEDNLTAGLSLGIRLLAIAIPSILVFGTTDPTDLADSLIQQWRVSPRFAIGALAALRMLPLLADEWRMITAARRARGVDAGRNPIRRARLFASTMFALLVGAIRRGTRLAVAMDARGFDSDLPRSVARPQRWRGRDWVLVCAITALAVAITVGGIALGTYRFLF